MSQHLNDHERLVEALAPLAGDASRGTKQNDNEYIEALVSRAAIRLGQTPVVPRSTPVLETVKAKLDEAVEAVKAAMPAPSSVPEPGPIAAPPTVAKPDLKAEAETLKKAAEALAGPRERVMEILNRPLPAATKADLLSTGVSDGWLSKELLTDLAYSGVLPREVGMELAKLYGQ